MSILLWPFDLLPSSPLDNYMENQSYNLYMYFYCGHQAAQFHPVVILVSSLNAHNQSDVTKKH